MGRKENASLLPTDFVSNLNLYDFSLLLDLQTLKDHVSNSLAVQWLGLRAFTDEGTGSIPGWGTKIP